VWEKSLQQRFERRARLVLGEKSVMSVGSAADRLWNEHEVARYLNVSVATIRRRRLLGQPPDFVKIGSAVRYTADSIRRLIDGNRRNVAEG
jgi:hypothetical protein